MIQANDLILGEDQYFSMDCYETKLNNNVLVVGASGSGKTRHIVTPNILQATGSYVIADPKGNLYKKYKTYLEDRGYEVKILDFIHPKKSMKYNPYRYIRNQQDILKLAKLFSSMSRTEANDAFWDDSAELLFSAIIALQMESKRKDWQDVASLLKLINACEIDETLSWQKGPLDRIIEDHEAKNNNSFAARQYKKFRVAAGKTLKSILITANSKLGKYDTEEIRTMLSDDEIKIEDIGKKKTAVFVVVSDTSREMDTLANLFFSQTMTELCRVADDEFDDNDNRLPVDVRFILDDFATNVKINDFPRMISSIRSRGISVMLMIQAESQLEAAYGKDGKTIIGNCDSYIYVGGNDVDTAYEVARRCDIPVTKVLSMPVGECLLFRRGSNYTRCKLFNTMEYQNHIETEER